MTTTAFDDQFTGAPDPVRQQYSTADILRRNVADLEIALLKQAGRAEAAGAELLAVREDNHSMMLEIDGLRKELAKLREQKPHEIALGKGEFVIWPIRHDGVHGLAFVKDDNPKAVGTSHAEPGEGYVELGAGDSAIYFGNAESAMVLAERLQYVIALLQSASTGEPK